MAEAGAVRWAARGRRAYPDGVAYERITIDPDRMSGLPCIRDTRGDGERGPGPARRRADHPRAPRRLPLPGAGRCPGRPGVRRGGRAGTRAAASPLGVAGVRLLIDANLSPKVAAALSKAGLESVHVGDVGLLTAPDRAILDYAAASALVIVSADSDFGELLAAARGATRPSVAAHRSRRLTHGARVHPSARARSRRYGCWVSSWSSARSHA